MRRNDRQDAVDILFWMTVCAMLIALWFLPGCKTRPGEQTSKVVSSQIGGEATGAGATLKSPNNASEPSEQEAYKRTVYQVGRKDKPNEVSAQVPPVVFHKPFEVPALEPLEVAQESAQVAQESAQVAQPVVEVAQWNPDNNRDIMSGSAQPAYVEEWTKTKIGSHQELDAIIESMGKALKVITVAHVLGVILIIFGSGGIMWSMGNPNGYMAVFIGLLIVGVLTAMTGNVWWLAVGALPGLFWLGQKLGIIRIPGVL